MENYDDIRFVKNSDADETAPPDGKSGKKGKIKLIIIIIVLLIIVAGMFALIDRLMDSEGADSEASYPYIGELYIQGTLGEDDSSYNQKWILNQIEGMKNSKSNKGLLLYVDSPGGAVYQGDELYRAITEYQEKTKRPVYSYYGEYAASGGYYISAGSDYIGANRFCTTGSIGVYYGPLFNFSGLMEKAGVTAEIIKSGENKAMGNSYSALTDEQRQIYQDEVDEIYDIFVKIVAEGRNLSEDYVRQIADGRAYTASKALELKLIDEICTLKDIEKKICDDTGVSDIQIFRYHKEKPLLRQLWETAESIDKLAEAENKSDSEKLMEYIDRMYEKNCGFMMMLQN